MSAQRDYRRNVSQLMSRCQAFFFFYVCVTVFAVTEERLFSTLGQAQDSTLPWRYGPYRRARLPLLRHSLYRSIIFSTCNTARELFWFRSLMYDGPRIPF